MLHTDYSTALVALSVLMASMASYAALDLAGRVTVAVGRARIWWLASSAIVMGIGIWSMHFVGMLAFRVGVPIGYDVGLVLFSVVVAIAASAVTLFVASRPVLPSSHRLLASVFMGPAIAGMHYTGMAALRLDAHLSYNLGVVAISVAIAIVASNVALMLALRFRNDETSRGRWLMAGSGLVMGIAISGMHYTGMAAAHFVPFSPGTPSVLGGSMLATKALAAAVAVSSVLILAVALVVARTDRRLKAKTAETDALRESEERLRVAQQEALRTAARMRAVATAAAGVVGAHSLGALREVLFNACRTVMALDAFTFSVYDESADTLRLIDDPTARDDAAPVAGHASERVMRDRKSIATVGGHEQEQASLIRTPVLGREAVLGVISVHSSTPGTYTSHDVEVLEAIAALAAPAMVNIRLLDEVRDQARELERSNAELERFAYVASHDLQEPLRMVTSYTQLLAKRYKGQLDADADEFIEFAVDGARRMQQLINDLLTYSKAGAPSAPLARTDSREVLQRALENLRMAIEESGAVVSSDQLPAVLADQSQLTQVLQNLIGNAIKFRGDAAPRIEVSATNGGPNWTFAVRDNGIGIEPQYADRIFALFQRLHTRAEYPGTGIGLTICKKIIERHGGRMWVESRPREGATFYFTLRAA